MQLELFCDLNPHLQTVVLDWNHLVASNAILLLMLNPIKFIMAAFAGFGVNSLAILVIKLASSLTLKASK